MDILSPADLQNYGQTHKNANLQNRTRFHPSLNHKVSFTPEELHQKTTFSLSMDQDSQQKRPLETAIDRPKSDTEETTQSGKDLLNNFFDIVNPLHHVPILGSIYRQVTGDEIAPAAAAAGGTLFLGPLGGMSSLAFAAMEPAKQDVPLEKEQPLDSYRRSTHSQKTVAQNVASLIAETQYRDALNKGRSNLASRMELVIPEADTLEDVHTAFGRVKGAITDGAVLGSLSQMSRGDATRHLADTHADPLAALGGTNPQPDQKDIESQNQSLENTSKKQSLNQVSLVAQMIASLDKYEALKRSQMTGTQTPSQPMAEENEYGRRR